MLRIGLQNGSFHTMTTRGTTQSVRNKFGSCGPNNGFLHCSLQRRIEGESWDFFKHKSSSSNFCQSLPYLLPCHTRYKSRQYHNRIQANLLSNSPKFSTLQETNISYLKEKVIFKHTSRGGICDRFSGKYPQPPSLSWPRVTRGPIQPSLKFTIFDLLSMWRNFWETPCVFFTKY